MANTPSPSRQQQQPVAPFRCVPANKFGWYCVDVFGRCINNAPDRTSVLLNKLKEICTENRVNLQTYYVEEFTEMELFGGRNPIFTFYVNDYAVAKELQVIKLPADCRMELTVTNKVPKVRVDKNFRQIMKRAMLNHYSPYTRELDLQAFHSDPQFKENFCCLAQNHCLSAAIQVMESAFPKVARLVLDHNHLSDLSPFHGIENILPDVMHISVTNNDLKDLDTFRVFQHLPLTQLDICKNPVDTTSKRRELAQILPAVLIMDGERVRKFNSPLRNPINDPIASRFLDQPHSRPKWSRNNSWSSLATSTPIANVSLKRSPKNPQVEHESNLEEELICKPKNVRTSKLLVVVNHSPEAGGVTEDANDLVLEKSPKPKSNRSLETIDKDFSISQLENFDKSDDSKVEELTEFITAREQLEESNKENTPRKINIKPEKEFESDHEVTPKQDKKNSSEESEGSLDELQEQKPKLEVTPRLVHDSANSTGSDLEKTPKQKYNQKPDKELVPDPELTPKPVLKDFPQKSEAVLEQRLEEVNVDITPKREPSSKPIKELSTDHDSISSSPKTQPEITTKQTRNLEKARLLEVAIEPLPEPTLSDLEKTPTPKLVLDLDATPKPVTKKHLKQSIDELEKLEYQKPNLNVTPKLVKDSEVKQIEQHMTAERSSELMDKDQLQESPLQRTPRPEEVQKPEVLLDTTPKPVKKAKKIQQHTTAERSSELIDKDHLQESPLQQTPSRQEVAKTKLVSDLEMTPRPVPKVLQENLEAEDQKPQLDLTPKSVQEFKVERDLQPGNQSISTHKYEEELKEVIQETILEKTPHRKRAQEDSTKHISKPSPESLEKSKVKRELKCEEFLITDQELKPKQVTKQFTEQPRQHESDIERTPKNETLWVDCRKPLEPEFSLYREVHSKEEESEEEREESKEDQEESKEESKEEQAEKHPIQVPTTLRILCQKMLKKLVDKTILKSDKFENAHEIEKQKPKSELDKKPNEIPLDFGKPFVFKLKQKTPIIEMKPRCVETTRFISETALQQLVDQNELEKEDADETFVWVPRDLPFPSQISEPRTKSEQKDVKKEKPPECEAKELYKKDVCAYGLELIDQAPQRTAQRKRLFRFSLTDAGHDDLQRFLNAYINAYDNDEHREGLAWFYKESALITYATTSEAYSDCLYPLLDNYHQNEPRYTKNFFTKTRDSAMECFVNAPKTKHVKYSMVIDLLKFKPHCITFTMSGFYCEVNRKTGAPTAHVYFMRTFVLNPLSSTSGTPDFRIACEISYSLYTTDDLMRSGMIPDINAETHFMYNIFFELRHRNTYLHWLKEYKVEDLSRASKVQEKYCRDCLIECDWNMERAIFLMYQAQLKNLLPQEAYI